MEIICQIYLIGFQVWVDVIALAATNGGRVTASVNQLKDGTGEEASLIDVTDDSQQMRSPTLIFLCFFTTDSAFPSVGAVSIRIRLRGARKNCGLDSWLVSFPLDWFLGLYRIVLQRNIISRQIYQKHDTKKWHSKPIWERVTYDHLKFCCQE